MQCIEIGIKIQSRENSYLLLFFFRIFPKQKVLPLVDESCTINITKLLNWVFGDKGC